MRHSDHKAASVPAVLHWSLLAILCGLWLLLNLHVSGEAASAAGSRDLVQSFEGAANNAKSHALDGLTYIRKIYKIPENDTVAPKPDPARFGTTTDPAVIQAVIDSAAELLDGQEMVWSPDIELFHNSQYTYYCDETILAIAWKERIDDKCCTCVEVKVADGSQLRRKLAGDKYDSGVREYESQLAAEANAVVSTNGDFYIYRQIGITVFQRQLYRFEGADLDTCFFTASGDMLLVPKGSFATREECEAFIADNDILFSAAFGPILVQDGQLQDIRTYRIGETNRNYSRAAIGMTDELHYFLMTINYGYKADVTATVMQEATIMYNKGCQKAYALDGGQTSELWMNGQILNYVDWNAERQVSDIIYFATALPSETEG